MMMMMCRRKRRRRNRKKLKMKGISAMKLDKWMITRERLIK